MPLQKVTFTLLGVILIISAFQLGGVEGVRLCGRRLADLLNFICDRHGGFHTPRDKREVSIKLPNKRTVIEIQLPLSRRTDPEASNDYEEESSNDDGILGIQRGIVDECCKKQCTLSTLVSYCANVQQVGNINLEEILPSEEQEEPTISEEELTELEYQQITSGSSLADNGANQMMSDNTGSSNRPNLGLSNRNRPVFIVLPPAQEEDN